MRKSLQNMPPLAQRQQSANSCRAPKHSRPGADEAAQMERSTSILPKRYNAPKWTIGSGCAGRRVVS
jgi:hypothetical protein